MEINIKFSNECCRLIAATPSNLHTFFKLIAPDGT